MENMLSRAKESENRVHSKATDSAVAKSSLLRNEDVQAKQEAVKSI